MAKTYGCKEKNGRWYVTKNEELYIQCGGEHVTWMMAKSLNREDSESESVAGVIKSMERYSEKAIAERMDPDFAAAVQRVIEMLKRRTGNG